MFIVILAAVPLPLVAQPQDANPPGDSCAQVAPGQRCLPTIRPGDRRSGLPINTLREMFRELSGCWQPPSGQLFRPGMELTVRLSFRADGTIFGEPRFTYYSAWASPEVRKAYRESVIEGLAGCAPLRFTPGMGGANAGRIFLFRYIDERNTQKI
ncbi:hypothetical protein [Variibacter gotjawalensis]|uniref:hypothetical protein n=1 Tax=Variibacter gotjawalensis TaxID=1333996 RepID=UPI00102C8433|nr:hypothetical protein [Variibacter gotjawalensis]NIK46498.1 hypothetical protein [Variibacter gotjawalensis]